MNAEISLYAAELHRLLDKIAASVEGLGKTQLNWRPPLPGANSRYVLVAHVLGNLEAWVLGIACGQAIDRDRPAEFAASGPDAGALVEQARVLGRRFGEALAKLPEDALDVQKLPSKLLWGEGAPEQRTVREALMETIEHAAVHIGHIHLTRDMAEAAS